MDKKFIAFRGELRGLCGVAQQAFFVTTHIEGQSTGLYCLDMDSLALHIDPLPAGANAIVCDTTRVWLAGSDGKLYQTLQKRGKIKPMAMVFDQQPLLALARLSNQRLAVLQSNLLSIVDTKSAERQQKLILTEPATVMAADPSGQWLVVGAMNGQITVFNGEQAQLRLSHSALLHQGQVTGILFEPNELRFYSASSDHQLLNTHARGELEAINRGKGSNHKQTIRALWRGRERFFTAADDRTIKAWPYSGGQPVTLKEGLSKITALTEVLYQGKPHLLLACQDQSLRLVGLDNTDRFTEQIVRIEDGYAWAAREFKQTELARREKAADFLAKYDDERALKMIAERLSTETDKPLREHLVRLLSQAKHPKASVHLERCLGDRKHETVRIAAYHSLIKRAAKTDLRPLQKALEAGFTDIGTLALQKLSKEAKDNLRALHALQQALNHSASALRCLALSLLEDIYPKEDPEAALLGLKSKYPATKRASLIRLFQRQLLTQPRVLTAVLLQQNHEDPAVRHTALLVAILGRPALTATLTKRDQTLGRQLQELIDFDLLELTRQPTAKKKPRKVTATAPLNEQDYRPLLQGMSNQQADVCLAACLALAVLEDQRAFALLLQLGQEKDATIRAEVCRALALLKDRRAIQQLEVMIDDAHAKVRDAGFTALSALQKDTLHLAKRGLESCYKDMHQRGLAVLLAFFSKATKQKKHQATAQTLLTTALNDEFKIVRQETCKACLNRQLGGDLNGTLQLLLTSRFQDAHQEVLHEVMANIKQIWAPDLLLSLLNDYYAAIRSETFVFAQKQKKLFPGVIVLQAGIQSQFLDIRKQAVELLLKKASSAHQTLLVQVVSDQDQALRQTALAALIKVSDESLLEAAWASEFEDIRVEAAKAFANLGSTKAYAALCVLAKQPEPEKIADKSIWKKSVIGALQGFATLGDRRAFALVKGYLNSKYSDIVAQAVKALPWVVDTAHGKALQAIVKNESAIVQCHAALALSYLGQTSERPILFSSTSKKQLSNTELLAAKICLDEITPATLLDHQQNTAGYICGFLALFAKQYLTHGHAPKWLIQALSSRAIAVQIAAADLLPQFTKQDAYWRYLQQWCNREVGEKETPWTLALDQIREIAEVLTYAQPGLKARMVHLLEKINHRKQNQWEPYFQAFQRRYKAEIDQARKQCADRKTLALEVTQNELDQMAFGAYLGIARCENTEAGTSRSSLLHTRHYAIIALSRIATTGQGLLEGGKYALLTLLHHPQQLLRQEAFDQLQQLGTASEVLGQAALASPQQDMAAQGLQLLVNEYSLQASQSLLQEVIKTADYPLALSAFELLAKEMGEIATALPALDAKTPSIWRLALRKLSEHYNQKEAQTNLQIASRHPDREVALCASRVLAEHQETTVLAALYDLLISSTNAKEQGAIVASMQKLNTPEVAQQLLHYSQTSKQIKMPLKRLYEAVSQYRTKLVVPELLPLLAQKAVVKPIFMALLTISGYDQSLVDPNDELADQTWLKKQYPRDDAILIQLFQRLLQLDLQSRAEKLIKHLRWAKAVAADTALMEAFPVAQTSLLKLLVEASGWRLRHRQGSKTGLEQTLQHKDSDIRFLAAEALASSGDGHGISILLSAIDYLENIDYRQRAVLALGLVGDLKALDKLLDLAATKEHALREVAVEALGHMASSDQAERIFILLQTELTTAKPYSDMTTRALNGLRWFNTLASWQTIEAFIADRENYVSQRCHAISLLAYRAAAKQAGSPSRALLLKLLQKESNYQVVYSAFQTAEKIWQEPVEQAREADFALLQGDFPHLDEDALTRVCRLADTEKLLTLTETVYISVLPVLENALLQRDQYPTKALTQVLSSNNRMAIGIAAHLAGRMPKLAAGVKATLEKTLRHWFSIWQQERDRAKQGQVVTDYDLLEKPLLQLIWTCLVHDCAHSFLKELLAMQHQADLLPFQIQALRALLQKNNRKLDASLINCLQTCAQAPFVEIRQLAQQLLACQKGNQTTLSWVELLHVPQIQGDKRLYAEMQKAAANSATQALALPYLIAQNDVETLRQVALNNTEEELTRVGAVEALGRMGSTTAEKVLQQMRTKKVDEEISKAAYRALRRSQRARAKLAAQEGS